MQPFVGVLHVPDCLLALFHASVRFNAAMLELPSVDRSASTRDHITENWCTQQGRVGHKHLTQSKHQPRTCSYSLESRIDERSSNGSSGKQLVMACLITDLGRAANPAWSEVELAKHLRAIGDVGQAFASTAAADLISAIGNFTRIPAIQDKMLGAQLQLYHTALSYGAWLSSCYAAAVAACAFLDGAAALLYRLQDSSSTVADALQELAALQEEAVQQQYICSDLHQQMLDLRNQATHHAQELIHGVKALQNLGGQGKIQSYQSKLLQGRDRLLGRMPHIRHGSRTPDGVTTAAASTAVSTRWASSDDAFSNAAGDFEADNGLCYIAAQSSCSSASCKSIDAAIETPVAGPKAVAAVVGQEGTAAGSVDYCLLLSSCKQLISGCQAVAQSVAGLQAFWSNQVKALQGCTNSTTITNLEAGNGAEVLPSVAAAGSRQLAGAWHSTVMQFHCYSTVVEMVACKLSC